MFTPFCTIPRMARAMHRRIKPRPCLGVEGRKLKCVKGLMARYTGNDWRKHVAKVEIGTTNPVEFVKKKVYETNILDAYIITWLPHGKAPYHNHASNGCVMKVLSGSLLEVRCNTDGSTKCSVLNEGDISYISDDIGYHGIENINGGESSVSLHVYSPPGYVCERVN